jgi:predicted O-linked N-acetylglucosamine transferase (SPINDLY family)
MTAPSPTPSSTDTSEAAESGESSLFDQALARYQGGAAPEDLIDDFLAITSQAPQQSAGWTCLAWLQLLLDQPRAALQSARTAVRLNPQDPQARINLGLVLERQGLSDQALVQWQQVVGDVAMQVIALNHRGRLHESLRQYAQAEAVLTQSLRLNPHQPDAIQHWVHLRQKQCKWPVCQPLPGIRVNDMLAATSPLAMLSLHDDPSLQWMASRAFVERKFKLQEERLAPPQRVPHDRIRIGYLSGDLCTHAVGLLMADLIESHDKTGHQ